MFAINISKNSTLLKVARKNGYYLGESSCEFTKALLKYLLKRVGLLILPLLGAYILTFVTFVTIHTSIILIVGIFDHNIFHIMEVVNSKGVIISGNFLVGIALNAVLVIVLMAFLIKEYGHSPVSKIPVVRSMLSILSVMRILTGGAIHKFCIPIKIID